MTGLRSLWRLIRREIKLWQLSRETSRRRQVWLHTRLTMKHPNEFVRHKKSTTAVLDYMSAADEYDKVKSGAH